VVSLVSASLEAPAGLLDFLAAAKAEQWLFADDLPYLEQGLDRFLQRHVDFAQGKNLPDGWIPATTFWLLDDAGKVVAMSHLRHQLTPFLLKRGGNIGYYVMASERGRGYGTQVLAHTLAEARSLGLDRVLVSADSDNERSIRVIERNGGLQEDEHVDETTGRPYRRYRIELAHRHGA
jgi:predicted acetyltransferase